MALIIHQVAVGGYAHNLAYVIADQATKQAFVVDPSGDTSLIAAVITQSAYTVTGILITHTHHDHIDGLGHWLDTTPDLPVYVHTLGTTPIKAKQVVTLQDHDEIGLGTQTITVLHTPGHIDDAVCFYIPAAMMVGAVPAVVTGDTLFVGGCGRTTARGVKDLYESLAELAALPAETVVYPGHDYGETPTSTIGHEKVHNRFYQAKNFTEFHQLRLG